MNELLRVKDLQVHFTSSYGVSKVINNVDFAIDRGEAHGLVGESGSGKSVTARSVLGILPRSSIAHMSGTISYDGRDLLQLSEEQLRNDIRGKQIAMVFQDPMTALNPVMRIGQQLILPIRRHQDLTKREARARALDLLHQVGIPEPARRLDSYPHELSGGQRQRVMIAIALACDPQLLICDEPTTALDVTVQAQILDLFDKLREERGLAMLLVSHDLDLIAERCDTVSVMYAGEVVERGNARELFVQRRHPYSRLLEEARPRLANPPHSRLVTIRGSVPDLVDRPEGCAFAPRCPRPVERCTTVHPALQASPGATAVACHHPWPAHGEDGPALDPTTQGARA